MTAATLRVEALAEDLTTLLEQVDPNLDDACAPPDTLPTDPIPNTCIIDATDGIITTAEGAFFNWALAEHPEDGDVWASTTHNPFLVEAHLIESIDAVETEYGVGGGAAQRVVRQQQLQAVLGKAGAQ